MSAAVAATASAADPSDGTDWKLQGRFTQIGENAFDADGPVYQNLGPNTGAGETSSNPKGDIWDLKFEAKPSANVATRSLRSGVKLNLELTDWGSAEVIATANARMTDSITLRAAPTFEGGYLAFDWAFNGTMTSGVVGDGTLPFLAFFGWEHYSKAALSISGDGISKTTMAETIMIGASGAPPDSALRFEAYMPWNGSQISVPGSDEIRDDRSTANPGGDHAVGVFGVTPGAPHALSFELSTGVNLALFNVDYYGVTADSSVEYWNTATLLGVRLLEADGQPYAGAWSLESNAGIDYPLVPVPEPSAPLLWLAGALTLGAVGARRRRQGERPGG